MKPARSSSVPLALVLAAATLCPTLFAQTTPEKRPPLSDRRANPKEVFKETKGKSALSAQGLEVKKLQGREAGKAISSLPGAKAVTPQQLKAMKEIPKTGLYLLDLDHVPAGLEEDLKRNGYVLSQDGTLTKNGEPILLVVIGETYQVKRAARKSAGLADWATRTFLQALRLSGPLEAEEAQAASPFPWACSTWYAKWEYHGGFCRDYHAWTDAYAWGANANGGCASPRPLTRIQYIATYAEIGSHSGFDYRFDSDQSHTSAEWDIGCFWPAHGTAVGFHYAYWQDGTASLYRTWSWAH
jgi:hypothetical protein